MKHNVKILEPEELAESLPQLLEEVEAVPLVISGSSMTPFLVHGRDTVYLSGVKEPLKRGDMAFYRRENGRCILHRVYRVEGACYTMVGDAQTQLEPGIRQEQILARVTAVRRKGKLLQKGSFWWDFFEKIWIRAVPVRPAVRAVYSAFYRLFN